MKTCKRGHKRLESETSCTECRKITSKAWYHSNIEEKRAYMRKHSKIRYQLKKSEYKDKKRQNMYGISSIQYEQMFLNQNGACAICLQKSKKALCIDHNHATKKVRGLLCHSCNKGLGIFKDNPENLIRAIDYLRSYV